MSILNDIKDNQGNWPRQRRAILTYSYADRPKTTSGNFDDWAPAPDSWDDVRRAANLGFITTDQFNEVNATWIAEHANG